ncbi:hypothetical protein [Salipaludibacillus aurantiacus]|uniref:Uncharacterized protein n=1 Tax=Salipaludibacillus aurantiacus TaxID=1601833 RepID=A0A1H9USI2_9BACI|nr:hypothetical protein [Salipaludibacillus aurantiacus]SES12301.1 hypothetical protein SAMN05518684_108139 [Salipaludibacillus aurantiacus]
MSQFNGNKNMDDVFKSMNKKLDISKQEQNDIHSQMNKKISRISKRTPKRPKWKYYLSLTAASIIIVVLSLPLFSNIIHERTGNEGIYQILNEVGYQEVVHKEEVETGVVVFYAPDIQTNDMDTEVAELGAIFIEKTLWGWEETFDRGAYTTSINEEVTNITSQYLSQSHSQSPFPMIYGEIMNPNIVEIKVINLESNKEYEAEITIKESHKIWFVFVDNNEETNYEVQGLSEKGEVVTSNLVNEDESSSGIDLVDE